jgi:hypothetical protein
VARGQPAEARAFFERAIAIYDKALGPDSPAARDVRAQVAELSASRTATR